VRGTSITLSIPSTCLAAADLPLCRGRARCGSGRKRVPTANYKIVGTEPDGTGLTVLRLEAVMAHV
jgi:hypothetical protein